MSDEQIIEETTVEETVTEEVPQKKKLDARAILDKLKKTVRELPTLPGKAYDRGHDWMCGTEDKPLRTYSWRAKFRRWFLIHYRNHVYCIYTFFDNEHQEYNISREIIPRKELCRYAVPVTNMKFTYHYDLENEKRGFSTENDTGFTAVDAFLYMKCNKIEDAMRINLDRQSDFDAHKLIILGCVAAGIIIGLYFYMMQGSA